MHKNTPKNVTEKINVTNKYYGLEILFSKVEN